MNDNQAVCLKCGVKAGAGKGFCPSCGNAVVEDAVICVKCGVALKNTENGADVDVSGIKPRDIVKAIIFSIITCGIYGIYWFVCLTNEMNKASGKTADTGGGMAAVLTIITCGIYGIYWAYKMGEKRDIVANDNSSSSVLYLVLSIVGLNIVVYCLTQDTLNKAIEKNK